MGRSSADELLTTTRSVRRRLDLSRPVPLSLIEECIEIALQAPTGGNRQTWHFVVVTDAEKRTQIADLYTDGWNRYLARLPATQWDDDDPRRTQEPAVRSSTQHLVDHLHQVPVHVIPCVEGTLNGFPPHLATFWILTTLGSVLPAAWSFMLAARSRGLGTSWTTLHLLHEKEVADLLRLPPDIVQCALIPVAYYLGNSFSPAPRLPATAVTHVNQWDTMLSDVSHETRH